MTRGGGLLTCLVDLRAVTRPEMGPTEIPISASVVLEHRVDDSLPTPWSGVLRGTDAQITSM